MEERETVWNFQVMCVSVVIIRFCILVMVLSEVYFYLEGFS